MSAARVSSLAPVSIGYCSNVHAGESLEAVLDGLCRHVPVVRAALRADRAIDSSTAHTSTDRLPIGLRLSAAAMTELDAPAARARLCATLDELGARVFTLNGFPYGRFHAAPVKSRVYAPDWSTDARLAYTNALARLLASLVPEGARASVSTVPGSYKPWVRDDPARRDRIVAHLLAHVASLVRLERTTGRTITLALEPEPGCLIETVAETVTFFETRLYAADAVARLARETGLDSAGAARALRRHLGVCYDVCHAAVEFEDARASLAALIAAGIPILKLQLSSALRIPAMNADIADELARFDEPVYLHQVVQRAADGGLRRYDDLGDALVDWSRSCRASSRDRLGCAVPTEWRVHFHVPVFLESLPAFETTQAFLREVLVMQREQGLTSELEIETYTWDVLPEPLRDRPLGEAIAAELLWVQETLVRAETTSRRRHVAGDG